MCRKILFSLFIVAFIIPSLNVKTYANQRILKIEEIDYEDAQRLMKIAQAEAGNQGIAGMSYVMRVVLNRVNDDDFPNTVKEVIEQPHQFESYSNGSYQTSEPSIECHLALAELERGYTDDYEIIGFEVSTNNSLNRYFKNSYTINDHIFYKKKED